ncbi:MAG: cation transporter [Deltaproteobacteria bacterium]|nr:cation transporter [Deltaproteobacteria bacterium]
MDLQRQKLSVAWLSVISNTTLVILKLIIGLSIGAVSIISEAIHSAVDLIAAIITLFSVNQSNKPADKEHPFGHGKVENISGTIEALLIFIAAGWIIFEAVKKLLHPEPMGFMGFGVAVMLFSSMVNLIVSQMLFKVAKKTDSVALLADAWHLRTDVYTSAGVMFSLAVIWIGNSLFPNITLQWLDPIAAIAVALLIVRAAYKLTIKSSRDLIDAALPPDEKNLIRKIIIEQHPTIHGFHKLRTRKAGNVRFIEFHMKVDPKMTVEESHQVTIDTNSTIHKHFPGASVTIHIEPCDGRCDRDCAGGCLMSEEDRMIIRQKRGTVSLE